MAAKRADSEQPNEKRSGRASWRGAQREAAPVAQRSWQQNPEGIRNRAVARKNFRRRLKLAASAVVFLALLGAFAVKLLFRAPPTPLLAAAVMRYADPLPPNAWAYKDVERMKQLGDIAQSSRPLSSWSQGQGPLAVSPIGGQWETPDAALDEIDGWLKQVHPGGPDKNVVLLYISAHGFVDGEGRSCLLLADPEFADRQPAVAPLGGPNLRWLPVHQLVERLDAWRPEVKKLLILDANRMESNWRVGLLYNAFAEGLDEAVKGAPSVTVLNSAGPGEIAWAGPDLEGSAFGYAVCQALAGDLQADRNRNGKISLQEFAAYVRGRTADWTLSNRFDVQSPRLVPSESDFNIVWAAPAGAPAFAAPEAERSKSDWKADESAWTALGELWNAQANFRQTAGLSGSPVWREHCLKWREFERGLIRCEQLALAGDAYGAEVREALGRLQTLSRELAVREQTQFPVHSFPLARLWRTRPESADAWRKVLIDSLDNPSKPPSRDALSDYLVRAEAAWSWLTAGDPQASQARLQPVKIRQALKLAGRPEEGQQAELAELHFLRLLAGDDGLPEGSNLPDATWREATAGVLDALKARSMAEQAAALADERAQDAAWPLVAAGDEALRKAEDALLVGLRADFKAEPFRQTALDSYQQALKKAESIAAAYAARDRAWADLPYLAEWFARRASPKAPSDAADNSNNFLRKVLKTVSQTHELESMLGRSIEQSLGADVERQVGELEDTELQLDDLRKQIDDGLEDYRVELHRTVQGVLNQEPDERTLRDIEPLMRTPLVSGEQRKALRERYLEELRVRIGAAAGSGSPKADKQQAPDVDEPNAESPRGYLQLAASWPKHPALAILGGAAASDKRRDEPDWKRLARQGDEVRRLLGKATQPESGEVAGAEQKPGSVLATRSPLSAGERRLRAAAALSSASLPENQDPTRRLMHFDRNRLLVRQAERRLDDFWGSGGAEGKGTNYFADAFADCRAAAEKLKPQGPDLWRSPSESCAALERAAQGVKFTSLSDETPRLKGRQFTKIVSLQLAELPAGVAALFVEDALNRPAEIHKASAPDEEFAPRAPIIAGAASAPFDASIRCAPTEGAAPDDDAVEMPVKKPWKLVWFYRGHRRSGEFYVRHGKSIELAYQRPPSEPATVVVEGEGSKEASVVFIFDCSRSMNQKIADGQNLTRMDKAREALSNIIEELADTGSYRVALWLYGHRRAVTDKGNDRWNPAWGPEIDTLLVGDDVQEVFPLDRLDKQREQELLSLLNNTGKVQSWGVTPLYLAIVEALEQYNSLPVRGPRRLVVITDGENDQRPKSSKITTDKDVQKAVDADRRNHPDSPMRIQLLDCAPRAPGGQGALQTLFEKQLHGKYIPVKSFGELERELKEALGLIEYEVAPADAADGGKPHKAHVDVSVEVDDDFGAAKKYEVRLLGRSTPVRSPIELEGGEAIRLMLSREKNGVERLQHQRYDRGGETEDAAVSPETRNPAAESGGGDVDFNPPKLYIAAHTPETRAGNTMRFPISIQNADEAHFSPRPAEAWVEITPVFPKGQAGEEQAPAGPYPICDLWFESQKPVPVLLCDVPDWPAGASSADLRVWLKLKRTPPAYEERISELVTKPGQVRKLALPEGPMVELGLQTKEDANKGGCRMIVDEEHPVAESEVEWLRIEPVAPADEIRRKYNYVGCFARHEFWFRNKSESQVRGDRLRITTRSALRSGAVAVEKPLRVTIQD